MTTDPFLFRALRVRHQCAELSTTTSVEGRSCTSTGRATPGSMTTDGAPRPPPAAPPGASLSLSLSPSPSSLLAAAEPPDLAEPPEPPAPPRTPRRDSSNDGATATTSLVGG